MVDGLKQRNHGIHERMANNHANNNNFESRKMDKRSQKTFSVGFNVMDLFYNVFKKMYTIAPEPPALIGITISFN